MVEASGGVLEADFVGSSISKYVAAWYICAHNLKMSARTIEIGARARFGGPETFASKMHSQLILQLVYLFSYYPQSGNG